MRIRRNIEKMSVEEVAKLKRVYKSLQDESNNGYELIAGIHGLPDTISWVKSLSQSNASVFAAAEYYR